ncbi:MAG: XdhC family protein [Pseudomonadota bacterium]|nr:XdhC family protein [Pseudomonadota bacterium]MEC8294930.1 XdhC family protein [Pseudomonadota bacterium]
MADLDIFDHIEGLRARGTPFCVATVLRTADVTSAKAGAKAAVTSAGDILGHLGGACVQRAVIASAEEALREGGPRMIRVKPSEKVVSLVDEDGVQLFKSGCPSGGTVDLLIEPFQLVPQLVIFGDGPIAQALAAHAELAGLRVRATLSGDDPAAAAAELQARDFVVVASQGRGDALALKAALTSDAARVSMVASRKKAGHLTAKLAKDGVTQTQIARLKSPAGLDIGAVDPHEIALSILAEIITWRAATKHPRQIGGPDGETTDPAEGERSETAASSPAAPTTQATDRATQIALQVFPRCC